MEYLPNWKYWQILTWNTFIAAVSFIGIHFLCFGLKDPSAYDWSVIQILISILLALGYAHLYEKVSLPWRGDYSKGFVHVKGGGSSPHSNSWTNFFNALIFAVLVSAIVIMVLALAGVLVSTVYIYFLDGIRGAVPPLSPVSAATTAAQVGVATVGMELMGKTEGQPPRTP